MLKRILTGAHGSSKLRDGARALEAMDEGHPDPSPSCVYGLVLPAIVMGMLLNPLALFFFSGSGSAI